MSDFPVGLCVGLAIGFVLAADSDHFAGVEYSQENQEAVRTGEVSPRANCEIMAQFQERLNEQFAQYAPEGTVAPEYTWSVEDCEKIISGQPARSVPSPD